MTLQEAETLSLTILKQVMEYKINSTNVEIACITVQNPKFRELEAIIARLK
jgi:20S proteasome subunit alpha 5